MSETSSTAVAEKPSASSQPLLALKGFSKSFGAVVTRRYWLSYSAAAAVSLG